MSRNTLIATALGLVTGGFIARWWGRRRIVEKALAGAAAGVAEMGRDIATDTATARAGGTKTGYQVQKDLLGMLPDWMVPGGLF